MRPAAAVAAWVFQNNPRDEGESQPTLVLCQNLCLHYTIFGHGLYMPRLILLQQLSSSVGHLLEGSWTMISNLAGVLTSSY